MKKCLKPFGLVGILVAVSLQSSAVSRQTPDDDLKERFRVRSERFEKEGLAQPFLGVTTHGEPVTGLFPIRSNGVTTEPVRRAAEDFLASLTAEQRQKSVFAVDDPEWRKWMNQHFYVRQGTGFDEMTDGQREAAFGLIRASLSAGGTSPS